MSNTIEMITKICKEIITNKDFDNLNDDVASLCKKINCSSICPFDNGIQCFLVVDNKVEEEHRKKIAENFLNENEIKIESKDEVNDKYNKTKDNVDISCETCNKYCLIQSDCSSCIDFNYYEKKEETYIESKKEINVNSNEKSTKLKDEDNISIKEDIVSENKINKKLEEEGVNNTPSIGNLIFYKNQICSKNIGFIKQVHRVIESEIEEDINKTAYIVQPIEESKSYEIITEDKILKVYEEKR